ncbi:hypothetical protein ENKO_101 [Klebsiella phage fENko-Kae01]|nr:hypothetical protein [Klebsiella phage fENko-Kae01]
MKNIQPLLFFFELVNQWRFNYAVDVFNLKPTTKYSKMFGEIYVGLSHPQSQFEMYYTSKKRTGAIGLLVEDKSIGQPVLFGDLQAFGYRTVMHHDWMYLPMGTNKIVYANAEDIEVNPDIMEDEHFQLMMLHTLPEFEHIKPAIEVHDYLKPIVQKHDIGFDISYEHLKTDFSGFVPSAHALDTIDSIYANALELYYEAEEHGNPFSNYIVS